MGKIFIAILLTLALSACETELTHYNNIPARPSLFEQLTCGNGIPEGKEECDGQDFRGLTCASYGYDTGDLNCRSNCTISEANCYYDSKNVATLDFCAVLTEAEMTGNGSGITVEMKICPNRGIFFEYLNPKVFAVCENCKTIKAKKSPLLDGTWCATIDAIANVSVKINVFVDVSHN